MSVLLTITIALLITFIGGRISAYFKYPPILGQFIISLLFAIPFVKGYIFTAESINVIEIFAELAIIFLLLLAGLKTDIDRINQCRHESIFIATFATLVPLACGTFVGWLLGFNLIASFILGISLSITAEATNLAILLQLRKLKTKIGSIVISAGMLNDIFSILLLSLVLILAQKNAINSLFLFPFKVILFVIIVGITTKLIPPMLAYFEERKRHIPIFNAIIIIALSFAILSEVLGLSAILGAFIAGIILQKSFEFKRDEKHEEHEVETILFGFIIPFFFINIALNFDFKILIERPALVLTVVSVAIFGKIIGTLLAKPFSKLKWKQLYLIGWEMNSRGVIELVIANIALNAGLISTPLYSTIVLTAILTTVISPFFIKDMINHYPQIMTR